MKNIKKIAVLGSGTMGIGISTVLASYGYEVLIWNHKDDKKPILEIKNYYDRLIYRNKVSQIEADNILSHIRSTKDLTLLVDVDLIIESVVEDIDVKRTLLTKVEQEVHEDTIIVTNTSTIKIEELAINFKNKNRFAGLHFFNPVAKMDLVEIIKFENTDLELIKILKKFVESINKEHVIVSDSPGFIVNRLLMAYINNAIKLLEEKISTAEDIDKAIRLGTNNPMGPLELGDLIGLDVVYNSLLQLHSELKDDEYKPSKLLKDYILEGKLGRKTNVGIYEYWC